MYQETKHISSKTSIIYVDFVKKEYIVIAQICYPGICLYV